MFCAGYSLGTLLFVGLVPTWVIGGRKLKFTGSGAEPGQRGV